MEEMGMRKFISTLFVAIIFLNVGLSNALAAVTEEEVNAVLVAKGMDRAQLQEMLDYFEISLDDFESQEELSEFIGTPVTNENLDQLLSQYGMTREELDALLAEFGTSVEEQWSIEEIDVAIDFYLNHQNDMADLEEFLAAIGLLEDEIHKLFAHFEALDQLALEEKMEALGGRLENLMMLDPESELTDAQRDEVISVWEDMMAILNLSPKFYLVDASGGKTPISFRELAAMDEFTSEALFIELYTTSGELLLDMQVSKDMLSSDFIINAAEKFTDIGDIAGELTKLKHERLPDTATSYGMNILLGLLVLFSGIALLIIRNKNLKQVK